MRKWLGLSMLETVISIFLLLACFLIVVNLFHSGLTYSTRVQNQQLAAMLAERQIEQLRTWSESKNGPNYNYQSLASIYDGQTVTASDFSNFSISTHVTAQALYSSCSQFELSIGAPQGSPRVLRQSGQQVEVTVQWDAGSRQCSLDALFSAPTLGFRSLAPIVTSPVAPLGASLARDDTASFRAQGFDVNGAVIPDLFFQWQIIPIDGNGTLVAQRDGSVANLTNKVESGGVFYHTGGSLYVQALARYHGQLKMGSSSPVSLAP